MELETEIAKRQLRAAFQMADVNESRQYLESFASYSPAVSKVQITNISEDTISGAWYIPGQTEPDFVTLYFHGGGYSFYPRAFYKNLISLFTVSVKCKTFALDYRLSPEHRYPAQLEDALKAYQWLLASGTDVKRLVIAGDSAGGNMTLALLVALRERGLPLPAIAVTLSPATDFEGYGDSLLRNESFDWIDTRMAIRWADWFCDASQRRDNLVSPLCADLRGLPPIYVQAGQAEILFDSIQALADRARQQGADVVLESWPDMNHDFQAFGYEVPQSMAALNRIWEVIEARMLQLNQVDAAAPNPQPSAK